MDGTSMFSDTSEAQAALGGRKGGLDPTISINIFTSKRLEAFLDMSIEGSQRNVMVAGSDVSTRIHKFAK